MTNLGFLFPKRHMYTSGILKTELKHNRNEFEGLKFIRSLLEHEKLERRHNLYSEWKVPLGRHWPMFGETDVDLPVDCIQDVRQNRCILCNINMSSERHRT